MGFEPFDKDYKQACSDYIKAQKSMGKALKQSTNPHFRSKYANLENVLDACSGAFHDNNFAIYQSSGRDEQGDYVQTCIKHITGNQFLSKVYLVLDRNNMQGLGSAITYARRYGLLGLAGLAPEDDDANEASTPSKKHGVVVTKVPTRKPDEKKENF